MLVETKNDALFSSMPIGKAIFSLAVPTIISQLITVVYNMADTFFIGRLNDPSQVAAATIAMPVFMFLTDLANLFGIGGASVISRSLGVGNTKRAKQCAAFCIWTAAGVALLYGMVAFLVRTPLYHLLGAGPDTWQHLERYLFWTVTIGAIPTVMNGTLAHLIRAEGYSRQASFGVAFGGILNIILDPLFIFTFHLEIRGAAMATMLSNLIAFFYYGVLLYHIRKRTTITPSIKEYSWKNSIPWEVFTVGLPSAIMMFMSTLSNGVLNNIVASNSTEAIAGMGIAKKVDLLAFAIAQGMTQGTLPLIAYNYSSGNHKRMTSAIRRMFFVSVGMAILGTIFLYAEAQWITNLFIADEKTIAFGSRYMQILSLVCPSAAFNFGIITIFQAVGKKIQTMLLSFIRKGTMDVPLMLLINAKYGVENILWATPIADLIALCIALGMFIPFIRSIKRNGAEKKEMQV